MKLTLLDSSNPEWKARIEQIRAELGAPHNPRLMPVHFAKVVLPKLGGYILSVEEDEQKLGYGFLFPRGIEGDRRCYTLRYHSLPERKLVPADLLAERVEAMLGDAVVVFYDPAGNLHYEESHHLLGPLDFGRPGRDEVDQIRHLQEEIWKNPPDLLYPVDIHSIEFELATSVIVRAANKPAAFLFGFYKFGGSPLPASWSEHLNSYLRLESQTMGVHPEQRGQRIAFTLKRLQAENALAHGVNIINWTADPLQFPNAALNFSLLRAVAYEFHPDLYGIRNELNQAPASRFCLTWLVGSQRVHAVLTEEEQSNLFNISAFPEIVRVNEGPFALDFDAEAPLIAIEIPGQWSQLQKENLSEALAWREATDQLLAHYVGQEPGRYIITAAGIDGERRYLIGEQVDDALLERLVRPVSIDELSPTDE
jgi:predicted GNAT superfamily acetyltransferase